MNNKPETINDYRERINKVLQYINNHLGEELDLHTLSEVSNFSAYHFHRIIKAYLNEPLYTYIVRIRLETAARLLAFSDVPINDIAMKIGYDSQASLSKAFKNKFGVSPTDYRENSALRQIDFNYKPLNNISMNFELKPKIKDVKPKKVIYIQVIESYGGTKMQDAWPKLFAFMKQNKLFNFSMECIGVSHDDPNITEPERCRYDCCLTVTKDVKPDGEVGVKTLEGGKYAIFTYKGPYDHLGEAYNQIARDWLPTSTYKLREAPCYDVYLNNPDKTKPEKLKTDIYIPVE